MHAYLFSPYANAPAEMLPDLKTVKGRCRCIPKDCRDDVRVTLEDHPSDKAAFIAAFNGKPRPARQVLKRYRIGGPRGGRLIEIPIDED